MRNLLFIFITLILIVTGLIIFFFTRGDDDIEIIKKNLQEVSSLVEKIGQESPLASVSGIQEFVSFFADDCLIEVGSPVGRISGKSELFGTVSRLRNSANDIKITLSEVSVSLESDGFARSTFVVMAAVSGSLVQREELYPRQLDILWEKIDGKWKIKTVRSVEVLH